LRTNAFAAKLICHRRYLLDLFHYHITDNVADWLFQYWPKLPDLSDSAQSQSKLFISDKAQKALSRAAENAVFFSGSGDETASDDASILEDDQSSSDGVELAPSPADAGTPPPGTHVELDEVPTRGSPRRRPVDAALNHYAPELLDELAGIRGRILVSPGRLQLSH